MTSLATLPAPALVVLNLPPPSLKIGFQIAEAVANERHRIEHARGALRDQASVLKDQRDIQRDFEVRNEELERENQQLRDWVATTNQEHSLHDIVGSHGGGGGGSERCNVVWGCCALGLVGVGVGALAAVQWLAHALARTGAGFVSVSLMETARATLSAP
jgi:hypothetical protein